MVYFNGPTTLRRKTAFAASEGLAGVMVWELGQDDVRDLPGSAPLLPEIAMVAALAPAVGWIPGKVLDKSANASLLSLVDMHTASGNKDEL